MDDKEAYLKGLAEQLRKPEGEWGLETGRQMNVNNRVMNELGIEALQLQPNDTVLEIGMGNGFFVKDILQSAPGITYTGADYSETMISESLNLNREYVQNGRAQFVLSPAGNLPFEDETFDKALTVNTIYFMDNPEKELKEINRVLKPGGHLVVVIRSRASMSELPFIKYGFTTYGEEELQQLLAAGGYSQISVSAFDEGEKEVGSRKIRFTTFTAKGYKKG